MNLLLPYFKKNFWKIALGISCMLVVDGIQLVIPAILKNIIDLLADGPLDRFILLKASILIVLLGIVLTILRYFWRTLLMGSARDVEKGIREHLFSHILRLDQSYYDKTRTGDIMAHATSDINHIRMAFGLGLIALTDAVLLGGSTIGIMLYLNVRLTCYALIPMPLLILITKVLGGKMHAFHETAQESFSSLTELIRESFFGIRIIKVFNFEKAISEKVASFSRDYFNKNLKRAYVAAIIRPLMFLVFNISTGIILFYGGFLAIIGDVSVGELAAFLQYLSILAWPMIAFGWMTNLVQRGLASLKRINALLDAEPKVSNSSGPMTLKKHNDNSAGTIHIDHVSFAYSKKDYILKNISMEIEPGSLTGISGHPGSGKTSLLKLIARLYNTTKGRIYIDNLNINDIDLSSLRANIAYAPQESFLFSGTIKENIVMGKNIQEKALKQMVSACMLEKTIEDMPSGLDTIVGERGVTLSGGQKQRIALARTLIEKKPVILLDDPVSQMDTDTASAVIRNINRIKHNATLFIVSHRIAALTSCNTIYILRNGSIEDQGTHDELMNRNDFYKNAYSVQLFEEKNVTS